MIISFSLTAVSVVNVACTSGKILSQESENKQHYKAGLEYLRVKDWDRAELEFRYSLERDGTYAPAHFGLASLYFRKEDFKTAEVYIDRALRLKPDWAEARLLKGRILFKKEDYFAALQYFDETIKNQTNNSGKNLISEMALWKGLTYQQLGELDNSNIYLTRCLNLDPGNREANQAINFQKMVQSFRSKSDNRFRKILTSGMITRSEWAWLLAVELNGNHNQIDSSFNGSNITVPTDVPDDYWAEKQIKQSLQDRVFFEFPDNTFLPERTLRRAEIAITLKLLKENYDTKTEKDLKPKSAEILDLPDWHPLYPTVQEAIKLGILYPDRDSNIGLNGTVSGKDALTALHRLKQIFNLSHQK